MCGAGAAWQSRLPPFSNPHLSVFAQPDSYHNITTTLSTPPKQQQQSKFHKTNYTFQLNQANTHKGT